MRFYYNAMFRSYNIFDKQEVLAHVIARVVMTPSLLRKMFRLYNINSISVEGGHRKSKYWVFKWQCCLRKNQANDQAGLLKLRCSSTNFDFHYISYRDKTSPVTMLLTEGKFYWLELRLLKISIQRNYSKLLKRMFSKLRPN